MKKEIFPRAFFGFCVGVTIERFITLLISFGIGQGEFQPVMPFLLDKLPSAGDHFVYEADYKRFEVTVTKADERKALEIHMTVTELETEE